MAARTRTRPAAAAASSAGRTALVALWFAFLCWHVGVILYLRSEGWIAPDMMGQSLETVGTLFAPPFAAIGLFYWKGGRAGKSPEGPGLKLALASALLWNLVLFVLTLMVLAEASSIDEAYQLATRIGAVFVWLVAGTMSYAFAAGEKGKGSG
jgi:hypothetical protein